MIQTGIEEQNIFVEVGSVANEIKNQPVFQRLVSQKLKENDLLMVIRLWIKIYSSKNQNYRNARSSYSFFRLLSVTN